MFHHVLSPRATGPCHAYGMGIQTIRRNRLCRVRLPVAFQLDPFDSRLRYALFYDVFLCRLIRTELNQYPEIEPQKVLKLYHILLLQ